MKSAVFEYRESFPLESGGVLSGFTLAYSTLGRINENKDNVIWFCHALTANSIVTDWWPGMIGEGLLFDPERDFIVCANMLGSCYGSTDALSVNPESDEPYFHDFPLLTNRDIVNAFDLLRKYLGIEKVKLLLGGSMGGQQAVEWAIMRPEVFKHLAPIATNAFHSPWGIAFNESQRMAIEADATWKTRIPEAGLSGMKAARAVALLSYRGYPTYDLTQKEATYDLIDGFKASSYQQYQGDKLVKRFHAFAYWALSKAMDSHQVGRGRGSVEKALGQIRAKTTVIGLTSDILFPLEEQKLLAAHIPGAEFHQITSIFGHDGFLIEVDALTRIIRPFMNW